MERLARLGVSTVADLQGLSEAELVRELGKAGGEHLHALAFARDDRPVEPERETKSISMEDTFEHDVSDPAVLAAIAEQHAIKVTARLVKAGLFARTVTLKVRWPDFSSVTRSRTLNGATDRAEVIAQVARSLLDGLDVRGGVRLLGVGVAGLVEVAQEPLFDLEAPATARVVEESEAPVSRRPRDWMPGADVVHDEFGPAGCGDRVWVGSPSASRPPTPGQGPCAPLPWTIPPSPPPPARRRPRGSKRPAGAWFRHATSPLLNQRGLGFVSPLLNQRGWGSFRRCSTSGGWGSFRRCSTSGDLGGSLRAARPVVGFGRWLSSEPGLACRNLCSDRT